MSLYTGRPFLFTLVCALAVETSVGQPYLSNLHAGADDPLLATYAAPLPRSQFIIDEGYHFRYYDPSEGVEFTTDKAGSLGIAFKRGGEVRTSPGSMHEAPVVTASYSDLVRFRMQPFPGLEVEAHFQVFSSRLAFLDVRVSNIGSRDARVDLFPYLRHEVEDVRLSEDRMAFAFHHEELPDDWTKSHDVPYVTDLENIFLLSDRPDAFGAYVRGDSLEEDPMLADMRRNSLRGVVPLAAASGLAFQKTIELKPGESRDLRLVRGVEAAATAESLRSEAEGLLEYEIDRGLRESEALYAQIPKLSFEDPDQEATYWNAFSLVRQVMLPPEGEASYNYFVFSREPTWGWGHGGQVFHESLAMLAYVFMDPESAMNSQRVYMERQHDDGYINYRTGGFLNEVIVTEGERTTSAPWYSWINWELYRQTGNVDFLADAYESGRRFYEWWLRNRDADGDGLAEWGGHAVLESVRDGKVAVWEEAGWPSNFEAVDLNSMLVMEARSLGSMALSLGDSAAAQRWTAEVERRSRRIEETFWDDETGFYYHVDRDDHDFTFRQTDDLKRQEIIGFLPLWAGIAADERTAKLVEHLTDPSKFWRPHGIPSLSADDPYYDPMGYWNGPVWVEWQYLIFRGLLEAGYRDLADELAERVIDHVSYHLKDSHTFWELYSPDELEAGHHETYIWTALVARMMIDLQDDGVGRSERSPTSTPDAVRSSNRRTP